MISERVLEFELKRNLTKADPVGALLFHRVEYKSRVRSSWFRVHPASWSFNNEPDRGVATRTRPLLLSCVNI